MTDEENRAVTSTGMIAVSFSSSLRRPRILLTIPPVRGRWGIRILWAFFVLFALLGIDGAYHDSAYWVSYAVIAGVLGVFVVLHHFKDFRL